MLSPADCGPAVIALPQDVQAEAFDYPDEFFATTIHHIPRQRADLDQLQHAAATLQTATRPLIIAGGGVRSPKPRPRWPPSPRLTTFPWSRRSPGGRVCPRPIRTTPGPVGVTGCISANELAGAADVILAVGTRLQDFTTGSWTAFAADPRLIGLNAALFDAVSTAHFL